MGVLTDLVDIMSGVRIGARDEELNRTRTCEQCGKSYRISDYIGKVERQSGDGLFIAYLQGERLFRNKSNDCSLLLGACLECRADWIVATINKHMSKL